MTQYVLNVIEPESNGTMPPPEFLEPIMREVGLVRDRMQEAGVWVFAGGLHFPEASTVVRHVDGENLTTDGPFIEGKEHIGGFTVVDVEDLDAALDWAGQVSKATTLPIEVRPFRY